MTRADILKGSKVALISPRTTEKLFNTVSRSLGQTVTVSDQNFKVIGVYESKGGGFGGNDMDVNIYVPFKSAVALNPEKIFWYLRHCERQKTHGSSKEAD